MKLSPSGVQNTHVYHVVSYYGSYMYYFMKKFFKTSLPRF
jgi:hypothetical protein